MTALRKFLTSSYTLWVLLSLLALGILEQALTSDNARIYHILVHPTGEWAARFTIITLMITPLNMLFRGWRFPRYLMRNRRYFGVAAFGYAALHTMFYLIDKSSVDRIVDELPRLYIWTGWLAFIVFIPLAVTSSDYFMRKMGPAWKKLQKWTYAAAVLTLVHWAALHNWGDAPKALIHFAPLIGLTIYRIYITTKMRRMRHA